MKDIIILDTTLRDGEQSPGVSLNMEQKLLIAHQLSKLGVDVIEAGFPIASPGDFEGVKLIAKEVHGPTIAGLARAAVNDIQRAWEAVKYSSKPRIHTFIATSDIHLQHKLRKTRSEVLKQAYESVKFASELCPDVEFSAEDGFRSDIDYLAEVFTAAIEAGAKVINVPDTVGYATPWEFGKFIDDLKNKIPNINKSIISVHCHNDLGLAVANSLSAVINGAQQVECTINGIGERAGNASLEEIVMGLYTKKAFYQCDTKINTQEIYRTSRLVSSLTGMSIQHNKAVVGKNAFAHESGIHQDGVLKERSTYEIMNPVLVGVPENQLVLGKHSGRHAFKQHLKSLGYDLDEEALNEAFLKFKELADKKQNLTDEDLLAIVDEEISKGEEIYHLEYLHVSSGNRIQPTATIGIRYQDKLLEEAACSPGGPVDATYKAMQKLIQLPAELEYYSINAVTEGTDALGEVNVKLKTQEGYVLGKGVSTDIIEASARAYINALNKLAVRLKT